MEHTVAAPTDDKNPEDLDVPEIPGSSFFDTRSQVLVSVAGFVGNYVLAAGIPVPDRFLSPGLKEPMLLYVLQGTGPVTDHAVEVALWGIVELAPNHPIRNLEEMCVSLGLLKEGDLRTESPLLRQMVKHWLEWNRTVRATYEAFIRDTTKRILGKAPSQDDVYRIEVMVNAMLNKAYEMQVAEAAAVAHATGEDVSPAEGEETPNE